MRNELNIIEHIEKYLRDELSADEKKAFEDKLKTDTSLQKEVELQKDVIKGIERVGVKQSIQKSYKKYKLGKSGFNLGLGTIILVALVSAFLWYSDNNKANANELPQFNESGEAVWADADKYLESQKFTVNTSKDTVIETEGGIVMYIPSGSFLDDKGNEISGEVEFEVKEALNTAQIIQAGLSSKSGDRLLESAGMFYVNARKDGKTVQINPAKGIYTEVPADDVNPDMQLFDGKRMADGSIDWVDPKPLDKFLTPVDINSLNFYPPKYEPKLAALGYDLSDKEFKDSLYYSFSWEEKKRDCFEIKDHEDTYLSEGIKGFLSKNTNIQSYVNPISCDEFEVSFIIGVKTSQDISYSKIKKYEFDYSNSKGPTESEITLIGKSVVINSASSNIMNNNQEFFAYKYKKVQIITQKIKVKSEGAIGLKLLAGPIDSEIIDSVFIAVWISKEERGNKKCNGPYIPYPSIEVEADSSFMSSLEYGVKSPYLFTQDAEEVYGEDAVATHQICGINPAKIKAIWSDDFSNTLIATREFEERLKTIFGTCNDAVLDLYINNINLNLYEVDEMAASMASGESKVKFLEFASLKDGKVRIDEKRMVKLQKHYEKRQKVIAEAIAKTREKIEKENKLLDEKSSKLKQEYTTDEIKRKQDNFNRELELNLNSAYKQLGKKRPNSVRGISRILNKKRYRLTLRTNGMKNIDRYVNESTRNRETLDYTDPKTGKKAVIKYEPIKITIKDEAKFDRLFVYVLPSELNSFMRVKKDSSDYSEKLNGLMNHSLICLGYIDEQAYCYSLDEVSPQIYKDVELVPLSVKELKKRLDSYDNKHYKSLSKDFNYQLFEIKEQKRQNKLKKSQRLRNEIIPAIFPCSTPITNGVPLPSIGGAE